ncbi:MAG: methyl-accepting chemotaxis protein [Lachnospiraceae bacterium]|nr:methyl-accepting chemotaxis protein [Lachnospiraceae bacterium]
MKKLEFKKIKPKKLVISGKVRKTSLLRTLSMAFLVPVVLTVILGVVSYRVASDSIISTYKETAKSTVSAESDYFELICSSISNKALELVLSSETATFYSMYYKDKTASGFATQLQAAKKELSNILSTNDNLYSYTVIPDAGTAMSSFSFKLEAGDPHEGFKNSPEGQFFIDNPALRNSWFGYHSFIDDGTNSDKAKYAFTYIQRMTRGDNYLIFDMKTEVVEGMLKNMNFGENSYVGVISKDGREVAMVCGEEKVTEFSEGEAYVCNEGFYQDLRDIEDSYSADVKYKGKQYMILATPVGKTGMIIYALIPEANATSQVRSIRTITFVLVIAAVVIALAIGYFISTGISKAMNKMSAGLGKASRGDLTREFKTKRKDEFADLTNSLNIMITGIRDVLVDMKDFSRKVSELSNDVSVDSISISDAAHNTTKVMEEVAKGIMDQAENTEKSNRLMSSFSENIAEVANRTNLMGNAADDVIGAVGQGRSIMEALNKQSGVTVKITQELLTDIKEVEKNSLEIQNFVNVISDIAEETNLLSLNASIEAARAGDAGRGFSVVADEIRKLADQSMESGNNINRFAAIIEETTKKTTESASKTEKMILEQAQSLEETVKVFAQINESVETLVKDIRETLTMLRQVDSEKNDVQNSLQNISTVSEEVAASGEEVTATLTQQAEIIAQLSSKAMELNEDAEKLNTAISKFTV